MAFTGDKVPPKGSDQWKKNEKAINENGYLRKMRDRSEGIEKKSSHYGQTHGGKGSARRWGNEQAYKDGWDRIFGKKDDTK
jgi:hypothetical protein